MENLTLFEEEVLGILRELERYCDLVQLFGSKQKEAKETKENKSFNISTSDINLSGLRSIEDIDDISKYLWTKGLDFYYPHHENDNIYVQAQIDSEGGNFLVPLKLAPAIIKGKSMEAIKAKIKELINELISPKKTVLKKKHTIVLEFPETVRWGRVVLKVKEGLQDIEILYDGKHIKMASYIELGFSANKKNSKPDRKWELLIILSVLQKNDIKQATPDKLMSMLKNYSGRTIKKDNIHQTKKLLSEALRGIFNTKENPFTDNKKYYEPKFKILPVPTLRLEEPWKQGGRLNENVDYDDAQD